MQIIAHGVDLVSIDRIKRIWERHGQRFLERVYTRAELDYCLTGRETVTRLAGRFAAKEAVMKVLGTGWARGIEFVHIETLPNELGAPQTRLLSRAAERAVDLGVANILISISHTRELALASAIGIGRE